MKTVCCRSSVEEFEKGKRNMPNSRGYQSTVVATGNYEIVSSYTKFMDCMVVVHDKITDQIYTIEHECKCMSQIDPYNFITK